MYKNSVSTALIAFTVLIVWLSPAISSFRVDDEFNAQRVWLLSTILVACIGVMGSITLSKSKFVIFKISKQATFSLFIFAMLLGCAAVMSSLPVLAFQWFGLLIGLLVIGLCVAITLARLDEESLVTVVFKSALLLLSLYLFTFIFYYIVALLLSQQFGLLGLSGPVDMPNFSNPRFFNQLQAWLVPIIVVCPILINSLSRYKRLAILVGASSVCMLLFTNGRGIAVALTVAALISIWMSPMRLVMFKQWLSIVALGVVFYALFFYAVPWLIDDPMGHQSYLERMSGRHTSGRLDIWLLGLQAIKDNWLLGVGMQQTSTYFLEQCISWIPGHVHNEYLSFAIENGLLATGVAVYLGYRFFKLLFSLNESRIPLFATFSCAAVYAMFTGMFTMPLSQLVGAMLVGVVLSRRVVTPNNSGPQTKAQPTVITMLVLVATVIVVASIYQFHTSEYLSEPRGRYTPRFWHNVYHTEHHQSMLDHCDVVGRKPR